MLFRGRCKYCSVNRLGILDISHRKKPLRRKIELLVTGEASILLNLSGPDLPHHVDPRVANPRRCTSDRRGWIAISTVIAVKSVMGLDTQRSLVTFIIVAFIVLLGYGFVASLLSAI